MKYLLPAMLLGLAARPALAGAPPTVPASLDVVGLHLNLDEDARQLIQVKVNSLCRHQASLEARVALAEAAFPVIDQVLAQEGVPADFRYLVLQESALNGDAESVHGAVGYWQLKRETAQDLGLTVDDRIDERRHLTASTRAAARYLAQHNNNLHNWANALLSYNLGAGGARPYIEPRDANAAEMTFTGRTNQYLLDFVAQKLVFEPACAANNVPFTPWREVPAAPGQSLAQQAAALGADPTAVARLNSWLLAAAVPQDGRRYTLLVPLAAGRPVASAADHDDELASINDYPTEVPGLPEFELPSRRAITPSTLPTGSARPRVVAPVVVARPVVVATMPAPSRAQSVTSTARPPYVVAPHETLYSLARREGIRPADLAAWNNLSPTVSLQVGQVLRLSPPPATSAAPAPTAGRYIVAVGDTFFSISRRYGCSVADLLAHNERPAPTLRIGETLRVPLQ